jgi:amino acid transporter
VVSSAGIVNGFVGYVQSMIEVPRAVAIIALVICLAGLAAWGIGESVAAAGLVTLIEIGGLILIIAVSGDALAEFPARAGEFLPTADPVVWSGIFAGSFLAFYAFIGFEDMVNVAEETKDARRTVPRAIILTLAITAVLYVIISVVAVLAVPQQELAGNQAPLKLIFSRATGGAGTLIGAIGVLAMINGALIQLITAARVLYGLAAQGSLPNWFAAVNGRTRTPLNATLVVAAAMLVLALWFRLAGLAGATSFITLGVFALVNLALFRIKGRDFAPDGVALIPRWAPLAGFVVSSGFLLGEVWRLAGG